MTAGFNETGRIWRFTASETNDDLGGAVPTGTVLFTPVFARISSEKPTLALLEQGLETPTMFRAFLSFSIPPGSSADLQHNDQLEVTSPSISPFYGKRFVVIGIQHTSYFDLRRHVRVTLRRLVTANDNLLQ